jgi:hypothetical protein
MRGRERPVDTRLALRLSQSPGDASVENLLHLGVVEFVAGVFDALGDRMDDIGTAALQNAPERLICRVTSPGWSDAKRRTMSAIFFASLSSM